jgi:hypothetical protein
MPDTALSRKRQMRRSVISPVHINAEHPSGAELTLHLPRWWTAVGTVAGTHSEPGIRGISA